MQAPLYDKQEKWHFIWLIKGSLEYELGMIENDLGSGMPYVHQLD